MTQLIEHLMRGGTYGYYWRKKDKLRETLWWTTSGRRPPVPAGWETSEVYFGVNPTTQIPPTNAAGEKVDPSLIRAQLEYLEVVNCLFAEFDAKDFGGSKGNAAEHIKLLEPFPSVIVDSGGGYHCYWLLQTPVAPAAASNMQRRWVTYTQGDPRAKDLARVLRVPGTLNHKYDPPREVKLVSQGYEEFTLEELEEFIGPSAEKDEDEVKTDAIVPCGARNDDLIKLAGSMRRMGTSGDVVLSACWARTQKDHEEPLDLDEVQEIVKSAMSWDPESFLLTQPANHEGNAQCVRLLHGKHYLYCDATGWLHYNGKYWERDKPRLVRDVVRTLTKRREAASRDFEKYKGVHSGANQRAPNIRGTLDLLESVLPVKYEAFDSNPDELNVNNGVLDLRTGKVVPHDRSQRFTYCLNVDYQRAAEGGEWTKFLSEVVAAEDAKGALKYLQLAMGYTLTGHTREEVMFYLVGPTRSGKGTFIETVKTLLKGLAWEVSFDTFSSARKAGAQNFDLAPLKAVRFLAASEGERKTWLRASFVKRITGGNSITASFKYQTPFDYRPAYKIWLSSNFEPKTDPGDDGAWGRLKVLRFPNSYLGKEDKLLKSRLTSQGCLEGVLAWMVEGAQQWYELGGVGLKTPPFVQAAVKKARGEADYVVEWADESLVCTGEGEDVIASSRYYENYRRWIKGLGGEPRGRRTLTKDLRRLGFDLTANEEKAYDRVLSKWCRGLVGYRFAVASDAEKMHKLNVDLLEVDLGTG